MLIKFLLPGKENKKLIKTLIYKDEYQLNKYFNESDTYRISLVKYHNIIRIPNNTIMLKLDEFTFKKKRKYFIQEEIENKHYLKDEYQIKKYFKVLHEGKTFIISSNYFNEISNP